MSAAEEDQVIRGTCFQMCPVEEIQLRERQRRLHFFEILNDVKPTGTTSTSNSKLNVQLPTVRRANVKICQYPKADPKAMVKEFSRSAAGKGVIPSSLRTVVALKATISYLIDKIANRTDRPWHSVYAFMCDRIRAIRQDVVIQRIGGKDAIEILEKAARFHILAGYKLVGETLVVFDPKLNHHHTQDCLKSLLCFYDMQGDVPPPNRAEFEALHLLYNAGSFDALRRGISLPSELKHVSCVQRALAISKAVLLRNFVRFFRLTNQLSYLESCSLYGHYSHVRSQAVAAINSAYTSRDCLFPLSNLTDALGFNDDLHAREFCSQFGLETSANAVKFSKESFTRTSQTSPAQSCHKIDAKFVGKISTVLHHGIQVFDDKAVTRKEITSGEGKIKEQLRTRWKSEQHNAKKEEQDKDESAEQQRNHAQMRGVFPQDSTVHLVRGRGRGRGRGGQGGGGGGQGGGQGGGRGGGGGEEGERRGGEGEGRGGEGRGRRGQGGGQGGGRGGQGGGGVGRGRGRGQRDNAIQE